MNSINTEAHTTGQMLPLRTNSSPAEVLAIIIINYQYRSDLFIYHQLCLYTI